MGQEAGKPAWPKPAGGYQTITGRRYGRRHAYVSFRPTPAAKHRSTAGADWPERERNPVRKERPLAPKGKISTMFRAMLPGSANSVHPEEPTAKAGAAEAPGKKQPSSSRRPAETPSAQHKKQRSRRAGAGGDQRRAGSADRKSGEASAWPVLDEEDASLVKARVLSFVNIDSDEPDSSGGDEEEEEEEEEGEGEEEENPGSDPSQGLQRRLDSMIFELGKEFDYLSGLHSYLYTKSCDGAEHPVKDSTARDLTDPSSSKGAAPHRGSPEGQAGSDQTLTSPGTPGDFAAGVSPAYSLGPGHGADQTGPPTSQTEMVVRPKIRKQTSETHLEKRTSSQHHRPHNGEEEEGRGGVSVAPPPAAGGKAKCVSAPPFFLTQTERPDHDLLFSFPPPADRGGLSPGERRGRGEGAENGGKVSSDDEEDDIWEDLEDLSEKAAPFLKAEESSEGSEGEWSASWVSDSGLEKQRGSSEESWETLGGPDDPRSLENSPGPSQPLGEPAALEEGEVRWMMYNEETVSSSDEDDPEGMSHFVHPGLFILDGNNNLEDDSSVSEDLDAEWRLLDDFGEGFGMAQAISYVDPQLLTYMALEERLAQAMEAALAHLESLAIDVEQAYPPATEQIISCLPQITVQDDPSGQEQCCAICCCEYIKDEIATQLPCHHMFHKICVTLWLQKSGTCPVCRHVLAPALPEAPAPTSFVSDQDIPPSNHSAAGTR